MPVVGEAHMRAHEDAVLERSAWVNRGAVLDLDPVADDDPLADVDALAQGAFHADAGLLANLRQVPDLRAKPKHGILGHECRRMNVGGLLGHGGFPGDRRGTGSGLDRVGRQGRPRVAARCAEWRLRNHAHVAASPALLDTFAFQPR